VRVLLLVSSAARSGAEGHVRTLAAGLQRRGHEVGVVCPAGGWPSGGVPGVEARFASFGGLALEAHRAVADAMRRRPDVVHAHLSRAGYAGLLGAGLRRVPLVLTVHTETREPLYRIAARGRNRIVAVSRYIQRTLESQGVPAGKVDVCPLGTDAADRPALPRESALAPLGIAPEDRVLLLVGRLAPEKGQHIAVQALARVLPAEPRARLLCVGRDVEGFRALLQAEAGRLGAGHAVSFLEDTDDVPSLMDASEALLLPSVVESFGLVVAEAMARGRPALVSPAGALPELVEDGVTGAVVPQDPELWAATLLEWLGSPGLTATLGEAARDRARERFSLDSMLDALTIAYHRAMEGPQ
jgi:glycosyltransferase involved in cell wall biosynthesis